MPLFWEPGQRAWPNLGRSGQIPLATWCAQTRQAAGPTMRRSNVSAVSNRPALPIGLPFRDEDAARAVPFASALPSRRLHDPCETQCVAH